MENRKKVVLKQTLILLSLFILIIFAAGVFGVEEMDYGGQKNRAWVIDMFVRGGFTMYFILICSIVGVYIVIEKAVKIRKNILMPTAFVAQLRNTVKSNDITQVMELCKDKDICIAKVLSAGLMEYREGISAVREAIDSKGSLESGYMSKHMQLLGVMANMSPLLGFVGTVTGMISAFGVVAGYGSSRPDLLAAGVAEALITTAYGLFVGIPLLVFYYYFDGKISQLSLELQEATYGLISELMHGGDLGGI
ncbi:MAG: MotA/TolQ/ExbB proton channel family protein [Candidatus Firestonebacteria bacterium]|nr:MotA/TolQ/ExbB proton channel family protein [Candidatus Firestonebacteria bacterium]